MQLITPHRSPRINTDPVQGHRKKKRSFRCFHNVKGRAGVSAALRTPSNTPQEGPQTTAQGRHGDHCREVTLEALERPGLEASLREFGHVCFAAPFQAELWLSAREFYHPGLLGPGWGKLTYVVVEIRPDEKALIFVKLNHKPLFISYMHVF